MSKSHQNLKVIRFEEQMLPNWAQLLDLAARLSPVNEDTRNWFSRLTNSTGTDDARTVIDQCGLLLASLQEHREAISLELRRSSDDSQPSQIIGAWTYALDTMIQESRAKKTCSWIVEGVEEVETDDGGDIALRRVG
jgi:hypothetical protein